MRVLLPGAAREGHGLTPTTSKRIKLPARPLPGASQARAGGMNANAGRLTQFNECPSCGAVAGQGACIKMQAGIGRERAAQQRPGCGVGMKALKGKCASAKMQRARCAVGDHVEPFEPGDAR